MSENRCPVCGKYVFENDYDICDECGWQNDLYQENRPDVVNCANTMSLNQAKRAYKEGKVELIKKGKAYV